MKWFPSCANPLGTLRKAVHYSSSCIGEEHQSIHFSCFFMISFEAIAREHSMNFGVISRCVGNWIPTSAVCNAHSLSTLSKKSLRVYQFTTLSHIFNYAYLPLYTLVLHSSSLHRNVTSCFLWLASSAYKVASPSQKILHTLSVFMQAQLLFLVECNFQSCFFPQMFGSIFAWIYKAVFMMFFHLVAFLLFTPRTLNAALFTQHQDLC